MVLDPQDNTEKGKSKSQRIARTLDDAPYNRFCREGELSLQHPASIIAFLVHGFPSVFPEVIHNSPFSFSPR
jgi:hypothetical protein